MKVSTVVGGLLLIDLVLLAGMVFKPQIEIIKIFGDVAKVLSGALAGALAGEKYGK